jgi:hypothetical protein
MGIFAFRFPTLDKEHSVPVEETHHSHWPDPGSPYSLSWVSVTTLLATSYIMKPVSQLTHFKPDVCGCSSEISLSTYKTNGVMSQKTRIWTQPLVAYWFKCESKIQFMGHTLAICSRRREIWWYVTVSNAALG